MCLSFKTIAQDLYEHNLDEEKLESLRESIKHNSKKPNRWTYKNDKEWQAQTRKTSPSGRGTQDKKGSNSAEKTYESPQSSSPNPSMPNLTIGPVLKVVIYVLLGLGLAYLIYLLFINSDFKANGQKYTPVDLEEMAPSEIPKTELERLLEAALADQNYREAVRIYYLFILKDLSEKKWIIWEKEKTNMHYILEMKDKEEHGQFNTIVQYFEFIWYGKRNINQAQFLSIQPNFTALLTKLGIK